MATRSSRTGAPFASILAPLVSALLAFLPGTATQAQGHVGSSPFAPPEANDITFVVDQDGGLDTGCTFRSSGPLVFTVKTTRYVGQVNADGTLRDAATLVANGIVSATAVLAMPGFDVDYDAVPGPPFQPERDQLLFNGKPVEFLRGLNEEWVMNSFVIPIEQVRFPARAAVGAQPTPAENTITINIDTANSEELWCTAVDWATLTIKALSPVVLVHGNNSDGGFFDRQGFTTTLQARGIPFDNSINMPTDTVAAHAALIDAALPSIAASFGVDSLHLVAHSKGGLDSRDYLANYQPAHDSTFKVLSLTTLSTPHNGSVLADLKLEYDVAARVASFVNFSGFPGFTGTLARLTSADAGTPNLTTTFTATFNAGNVIRLPAGTAFHTVAADADTNGNARIDITPDEYLELRQESSSLQNVHRFSSSLSRSMVDTVYQVLRNTAGVHVTLTTRTLFGVKLWTTATITSIPTPGPLGNDTLVTIPSGQGTGSLAPRVTNSAVLTGAAGRNHSNVANGGVATTVLPWIFGTERSSGDLR